VPVPQNLAALLTLQIVTFYYRKFIKSAYYVWHRKSIVLSYIYTNKRFNDTHKKMLTINAFVR